MSLFLLVRRNLFRHPVRSLLTCAAATVGIFLLIFLTSIVTSLNDAVKQVSTKRVVTQSAVSLFVNMPEAYRAKIAGVPGVESVMRLQWFGGVYREPSNFFAQFAVDPELFLEQFPECVLDAESRSRWLSDRRGCIVGELLADRFGWKVGDSIPLLGSIFPKNGGEAWDFTVRGIYRSTKSNLDESSMWFHFDYLKETLEAGLASGPDGVGVFYVRRDDDVTAPELCERIDALFAGGPQRTLTQPEAAFQAGFVSMFGSLPTFLGWIGAAVLFALFMTLANTMLISSSERIEELGVLKALGFRDGVCSMLLLGESLALSLSGSAVGVGLSLASVTTFRRLFGTTIPSYAIRTETLFLAAAVAVAVGVAGGLAPAVTASRLNAAEALRAEI
ncbi:MAG TPA: ABC transporter permease [Planctomycetes bacterium]|nr:ABC transporter permease [Planctomycetota bacterium]